MKKYRLNHEELPFTIPPYSYEFIKSRKYGKWRIHDSEDNACGSAEDEDSAKEAVNDLNGTLF